MEIDKIYNIDCLEGMKQIPDDSVDLVVTSPPYDNLRTYGGIGDGWNFDKFKALANELARTLKEGGVIVWNVNDATIDGSETGSSFRQALYFKDECGLNLHDTMIWHKIPIPYDPKCNRYWQAFEYMFVFSKGKPTCNYIKVPCSTAGAAKRSDYGQRNPNGNRREDRVNASRKVQEDKVMDNVWFFMPDTDNTTGHPAVFPIKLARQHIYSWSQEGQTVLDPFMGSGTTAVACIKEKRHFIGFELNKDYFDKACRRIDAEKRQLSLF